MAILRQPEVTRRTGLARSTIYAQVARGQFPPPIQLTSLAVGWREDEVEEWLASRPRANVQGAERGEDQRSSSH